jgi:hypothetical protein
MIAQSVADILRDYVKLSVEGIDRMYLNVYVPRLQTEQGIVWFFRHHRGQPIPSAALMAPMSHSFVAALGHPSAAGWSGAWTVCRHGGAAADPVTTATNNAANSRHGADGISDDHYAAATSKAARICPLAGAINLISVLATWPSRPLIALVRRSQGFDQAAPSSSIDIAVLVEDVLGHKRQPLLGPGRRRACGC